MGNIKKRRYTCSIAYYLEGTGYLIFKTIRVKFSTFSFAYMNLEFQTVKQVQTEIPCLNVLKEKDLNCNPLVSTPSKVTDTLYTEPGIRWAYAEILISKHSLRHFRLQVCLCDKFFTIWVGLSPLDPCLTNILTCVIEAFQLS